MRRRPLTYLEHLERRAGRYAHRAHVALHCGDALTALELIALAVADLSRVADLISDGAA